MNLGNKIRTLRKERNLTQEQLAKKKGKEVCTQENLGMKLLQISHTSVLVP